MQVGLNEWASCLIQNQYWISSRFSNTIQLRLLIIIHQIFSTTNSTRCSRKVGGFFLEISFEWKLLKILFDLRSQYFWEYEQFLDGNIHQISWHEVEQILK
jgi:hypothetical protein